MTLLASEGTFTFYNNNNLTGFGFTNRNSTIKKEAYDANDDFLVKAADDGTIIEIGFYDVQEDGNVKSLSEKSFLDSTNMLFTILR